MLPNGMHAKVLGSPVEHSLSPVLHTAAYATLGLDWTYGRHQVEATELAEFLAVSDEGIAGYSLTMPLKDAAFTLAHSADDAALRTRACNTLIPDAGGWAGYNTDVGGFIAAFNRAGINRLGSVIVLGTGATARSAVAACESMGALTISVMGRRPEAIAHLATHFPQLDIHAVAWGEDIVTADTTLISTVPAGVADSLEMSATVATLFDVIYAPWPTMLVSRTAADVVLGGLDLLVCQAIEQVLLMTQCDPHLRDSLYDAMYAAGLAEQARRSAN